ncbi:MAG TPA: hypothetical protein VK157_00890 [Phycisphaerales bacterium]|nr:hypothetical protein [Phycisphaerales bacterium]
MTMTAVFSVSKTGKRSRPRRSAPTTTDANSPPSGPVGRIPRVTRLMALAIKLDELIRSGEVASQRELAAVAHVTPARVTQILSLLHLAPDIQETLLNLPPVTRGRDPITEREIRPVAALVLWSDQRAQIGSLSRFCG